MPERVYQFQKATVASFCDIIVAMRLDASSQIRPHHLHERLNSAKSSSIDYIYPFLKEGVLLREAEKTPYAHYWAAAQAESFRAKSKMPQTIYHV